MGNEPLNKCNDNRILTKLSLLKLENVIKYQSFTLGNFQGGIAQVKIHSDSMNHHVIITSGINV